MTDVTEVIETKYFTKQLEKVPATIKLKVFQWIFAVSEKGIAEVSKSKGYHDEPLKGVRLGQRSVRINRSYRLIYREIESRIIIELLEIHKHDY